MPTASWQGGNFQLGAGAIFDQQVNSAAAIAASKLQHAYYAQSNFGLAIGAAPVATEVIVHVANSAGSVSDFAAMVNVAPSSGSMTFDLHKNGSSILSAPITINNGISSRQVVTAAVATPAFNAGDVLSIVTTLSLPTGAQGPLAWAGLVETSAP